MLLHTWFFLAHLVGMMVELKLITSYSALCLAFLFLDFYKSLSVVPYVVFVIVLVDVKDNIVNI